MEFMSSLQNGLDELKPSLFELLSEQQLSSLLPPSIRYLLTITTLRYPRYLLRVANSFDEVYAVLMLLVERHFLQTYGGGFTENFYGLKRERVLRTKGGEVPRAQLGAPNDVRETLKLRNRDVWKNLAVMVGLPYLKRKLDESYDIHAAHANVLGPNFNRNRDTLPPGASIKQRLVFYYKWFLRHIYPSVNAAYYFSLLAFNLAYLFDGSKYHSPFMWLIGTRVRRLGEADYHAIELAKNQISAPSRPGRSPGEGTSLLNPRTLGQTVYPRLLSSLRILLPTSIFALKFLEWWHASDFARQLSPKAAESLDLPPPVISGLTSTTFSKKKHQKLQQQSPLDSEKPLSSQYKLSPPIAASSLLPILTVPAPPSSSLCPICTGPIITPTAAPTGYVYCYTCIHRWVEGTHERQVAFMEGSKFEGVDVSIEEEGWAAEEGSREGRWESGKGRCAVSGRVLLGGTESLRRVVV